MKSRYYYIVHHHVRREYQEFLGVFSALQKAKDAIDTRMTLPSYKLMWEEIWYDGPHWMARINEDEHYTIEIWELNRISKC